MRTGPTPSRLDQRRGVGDHALGGEPVGVRGRADPAVVERDDAVAGVQECGDLMQMPGASQTAAAGDEEDGLPRPVVVVSQVDHDDEPTRHRGVGSIWQSAASSWQRPDLQCVTH